MRSGIITFTSDFGVDDPFVGIVKGVILGIFPKANIVDLTHQISAHNVTAGAWTLKDSASFFPPGTVHLAVVDPGVGSDRRGIALLSNKSIFVGPDNGLFSAFYPADLVVSLENAELFRPEVCRTFHGRDVFAPVAARLASGFPLLDLGNPVFNPVMVELAQATIDGDLIKGEVIQIDRFGNLVTNIDESMVPDRSNIRVEVCGEEITGMTLCYRAAESDHIITLVGSTCRIEISLPNGSAADALGAQAGDRVEVYIN